MDEKDTERERERGSEREREIDRERGRESEREVRESVHQFDLMMRIMMIGTWFYVQ